MTVHEPPFFHHHARHPWAQPGDEPDRVFILRFADPDMREQVFLGEGAEVAAFKAYRLYAPTWNVYLLATVAFAEIESTR